MVNPGNGLNDKEFDAIARQLEDSGFNVSPTLLSDGFADYIEVFTTMESLFVALSGTEFSHNQLEIVKKGFPPAANSVDVRSVNEVNFMDLDIFDREEYEYWDSRTGSLRTGQVVSLVFDHMFDFEPHQWRSLFRSLFNIIVSQVGQFRTFARIHPGFNNTGEDIESILGSPLQTFLSYSDTSAFKDGRSQGNQFVLDHFSDVMMIEEIADSESSVIMMNNEVERFISSLAHNSLMVLSFQQRLHLALDLAFMGCQMIMSVTKERVGFSHREIFSHYFREMRAYFIDQIINAEERKREDLDGGT